jgi:hypothetical protein
MDCNMHELTDVFSTICSILNEPLPLNSSWDNTDKKDKEYQNNATFKKKAKSNRAIEKRLKDLGYL